MARILQTFGAQTYIRKTIPLILRHTLISVPSNTIVQWRFKTKKSEKKSKRLSKNCCLYEQRALEKIYKERTNRRDRRRAYAGKRMGRQGQRKSCCFV